jgi:hypothetical protein
MTNNYKGSCHCGQITFEVTGDLTNVMACNCSMCQRKGTLIWFIPRQHKKAAQPLRSLRSQILNL